MSKKLLKLKDLVPDDANFNKGSEFGNGLIEKSLSKFGAGRSILIDKNNRIIAGNKTIENAASIGLENVIVVETDGKEIVAVKRTDVDLNTKKGREMALADNATAKANIEWDVDNLSDWVNEIPVEEWGVDGFEKLAEEHSALVEESIQPVSYAHFLISVDINQVDRVLPLIQQIKNLGCEVESNVN